MHKEPVGLEEEVWADRGLTKPAEAEEVGDGQFGEGGARRRQVNLRLAAVSPGDVDLDEELAAGEGAALAEAGPGEDGGGDGDPSQALLFGEGTPALRDGGKEVADGGLAWAAGIGWDEGGVADHAIACALPDDSAALTRLGVGQFHNQDTGHHTPSGEGCQG